MDVPAALAEQQLNALGRLADLGLALATSLQRRAMEAEDSHEAAALALAFQRTARLVGQSIALQDRLARDKGRDARERDARERESREREPRPEPRVDLAPEPFRPLSAVLDDEELFEHLRNDVLEAVADRLCEKLTALDPRFTPELDADEDEEAEDERSSPSGGGVGKADGGGFTPGLRPSSPLAAFGGAPPKREHLSSA